MSNDNFARRDLLKIGAGVATGMGLAACGGSGDEPSSAPAPSATSGSRRDILPNYIPFEGAPPDLPGNESGLLPYYATYPAAPKALYDAPPGQGDKITSLAPVDGGAVPPTYDRNAFWQELNKRLNVDFDITMTPAGSYEEKLQTMIASDDLPEIVKLVSVAQLPDLLEARFADLTEHLSSDAIEDYPSLANIPQRSWLSGVYGGRIYGIPLHRTYLASELLVRTDITDDLGIDLGDVTDGDSFLEFCRAVTDPAENRWALGWPDGAVRWVGQLKGAPFEWKEEGGRFTAAFETDEYLSSIEVVAQMVKSGLLHPDAFTEPDLGTWLGGGRTVMLNGSAGTSYYAFRDLFLDSNPTFDLGYLKPAKWDGGGPAQVYLGNAAYGGVPVAISKAEPDRVKYLLSLLDYLAAPFGTAEHLFLNYGIEGVHHELDGSNPVKTPTGINELNLPIRYLAAAPQPIHSGKYPDAAQAYYEYQADVIGNGVGSAALGLYSPTLQESGPELERTLMDVRNEILQGRQPISSWSDGLRDWRQGGGDKIRGEYEEGFAASQ